MWSLASRHFHVDSTLVRFKYTQLDTTTLHAILRSTDYTTQAHMAALDVLASRLSSIAMTPDLARTLYLASQYAGAVPDTSRRILAALDDHDLFTDTELLAIAHDDGSPAYLRSASTAVLLKRGHDDKFLWSWRSTPISRMARLTQPHRPTMQQIRLRAITHTSMRTVIGLIGLVTAPFAVSVSLTWIINTQSLNRYSTPFADVFGALLFALLMAIWIAVLTAYTLASPLVLIAAAYPRQIPVILLLRPFGRQRPHRKLLRLVRHVLGNCGHVYTLQDNGIKRAGCLPGIIYFFTALTFPPFVLTAWVGRLPSVRSSRALRRLKRMINRTYARNFEWYYSGTKVFPLRCNNNLWKSCVGTLIEMADLIVVDATGATSGVAWELEECFLRGRQASIVLISEGSSIEMARAFCINHKISHQPIHLYGAQCKHIALINDCVRALTSTTSA
jgi:hypothetical protein